MSINQSRQTRQALLQTIQDLRAFLSAAPQSAQTTRLLSGLAALEQDVNGKKYGLLFEHHREVIDELLATHAPVLTEDTSLAIDCGGQLNFLLEGDNLAALRLLEKTHRGRIQMIYIDPPYNTGNRDFTYDDSKVDAQDGFRHSKWLSFMNTRLRLARTLLTRQGVIFLSIDDNEQAALKLLCDEIFGEENFVANIVIKSNPRGSQSSKEIASVHEYLLVYAKDILSAAIIGHRLTEDMQSEYRLSDDRGPYRLLGLRQRGGFWRASERPNLFYPFFVDPQTGSLSLAEDAAHSVAVYPYQPSTGERGTWRWSREKAAQDGADLVARQVRRADQTVWDVYQKDYLTTGAAERRTKARSLWDEKALNYQNAASELKSLFPSSPFTYAKPTYLIRRAIEMIDFRESPYILDFFAGSGTTGDAVLQCNAEDGGSRRFILCTNNENGICRDVTYERLRRSIEKEGYATSLKYDRVDFIPTAGRLYYEYAGELLAHMRELVELETGAPLSGCGEAAFVCTDEDLSALFSEPGRLARCRRLYLSHDLLPDEAQEAALAAHSVALYIVPERYYPELQEEEAWN